MSTVARARTASPPRRPARGDLAAAPAWAWGLALAIPLAAVYLILAPPSGDLAAAAYRSSLFARAGFTIWDNGWYAGHSLPAYSLLSPALGAWIGLRPLIALSAVAAAGLFGAICARVLPAGAARAAALVFAFGLCCELPSGRVPYDLGAAIALAAVAALMLVPRRAAAVALAAALAAIAAAASPVAGAFLALAGLATAISARLGARRARWDASERAGTSTAAKPGAQGASQARAGMAAGLTLTAFALAPVLLLAALFPEGGYEPFTAAAFWPRLAAVVAFAALLPAGALTPAARRTLRIGAAVYACGLLASFLLLTPVGSNAVRFGDLLGPPILVGALWQRRRAAGVAAANRRPGAEIPAPAAILGIRTAAPPRRPIVLLAALAPLLLYWQLAASVRDQVALAGDRSVNASYYAPLRAELRWIAATRGPIRVEVPMTGAHWESAYLPGGRVSIARGWERQLDTRYAALFYDRSRRPTPAVYRAWLSANAVSYVALPDARLDPAGSAEARLIADGLPYLRPLWRSRHWRLFAVAHPTPLVQRPARMLAIGAESFTVRVPRPGTYRVRLHWSPYWSILAPATGCVSRAGDWLAISIPSSSTGTVRVAIDFSIGRALATGPRCTTASGRRG